MGSDDARIQGVLGRTGVHGTSETEAKMPGQAHLDSGGRLAFLQENALHMSLSQRVCVKAVRASIVLSRSLRTDLFAHQACFVRGAGAGHQQALHKDWQNWPREPELKRIQPDPGRPEYSTGKRHRQTDSHAWETCAKEPGLASARWSELAFQAGLGPVFAVSPSLVSMCVSFFWFSPLFCF